ncbi:MAG: branched-chain amino acid ABC transporter permease [Proteobacteria bacterium]|nr:branched-chain amino acid ABC transporter permease [Pseudomonadota bacterium]
MDIYAIQALHGLVYGMLLFMVASGLTLVFGMMGVLNLAHASFYMLGAYMAYTITLYLGSFWLSLVVGPLVVGLLGVVIERFLLRKAHERGHVAELLLTFGLFYVIGELVRLIWGSNPLPVAVPDILKGDIPLFGMTYPYYRLFILCFSSLILVVMALVLMKTRIGILVRAAVSDAEMVDSLGTNVPLVFMGVFGGGAALAGMAGVIAAPFLSTYPGMGLDVLMDCFVIIVIGGFGSLFGALLSAVMIGELQSFGVLWIPRLALVFQFLFMAVVLIVRPTGLLGEKE